jgi:alpha-galactosidase
VDTYPCNRRTNQNWIWNEGDRTIRSKVSGECLTVPLELEIWAGPLKGGSQAVVLLNRGVSDNEQITVKWTDIGFPADHPALVRDLWAHKDLGIFTDHFTSPNIASHAVMMLNITLTK